MLEQESPRESPRHHGDSRGLWVPSSKTASQWYFIDENRAYRGPVPKNTLHYLYSTGAITRNTYVFTENLTSTREWVRIRKLPELLAELQLPLDPAHDNASPAPSPMPSPAPSPRLASGAPTSDKRAARDAKREAAATSPRGQPAAEGELTTARSMSRRHSSYGARAANPSLDKRAPLAADSPMVATSRMETQMAPANLAAYKALSTLSSGGSVAKLSELIKGDSPNTARGTPAKKFSLRNLVKGQPKYKFGQPLESVKLDDDGVPEVLSQLRALLWEHNGHLIEGIFRVPPSVSALKAARQQAEEGRFDKISDMESVAQMIKLWLRELPESIFGPCLPQIVDGPPDDAAQCDRLIQQLPEANRTVIYWLLDLITDICRYEPQNRMTAQSMTIVLAPNLVLAPPALGPLEALELNSRVVHFTELLFSHWNSAGIAASAGS